VLIILGLIAILAIAGVLITIPMSKTNSGWLTWIDQHNGLINALGTLIIAAFTVVLALATMQLQQLAEKQSEDTVAIQRPFLSISTFETYVVGNELRILPKWENSGATPANPVKNWANWKTFPSEPPSDFNYPDLDANGNPTTGTPNGPSFFIGAKASRYSEILKIPIATLEQVRNGALRLFIWGWAEYHDAFVDTARRTEYCNELVVTSLGRDGDKVSVAASFAAYGSPNKAN